MGSERGEKEASKTLAFRSSSRATVSSAFTIVELLIVIVIIAILAAVTIVSYQGITARAQQSKIQTDLTNLEKAIILARENTGKPLKDITISGYTGSSCNSKTVGTDLASLSKSDSCWTVYASSLDKISVASNMNVRQLVDPWGRPYFIDENEGESSNCSKNDVIGVYSIPLGSSATNGLSIPLSGYASPCN